MCECVHAVFFSLTKLRLGGVKLTSVVSSGGNHNPSNHLPSSGGSATSASESDKIRGRENSKATLRPHCKHCSHCEKTSSEQILITSHEQQLNNFPSSSYAYCSASQNAPNGLNQSLSSSISASYAINQDNNNSPTTMLGNISSDIDPNEKCVYNTQRISATDPNSGSTISNRKAACDSYMTENNFLSAEQQNSVEQKRADVNSVVPLSKYHHNQHNPVSCSDNSNPVCSSSTTAAAGVGGNLNNNSYYYTTNGSSTAAGNTWSVPGCNNSHNYEDCQSRQIAPSVQQTDVQKVPPEIAQNTLTHSYSPEPGYNITASLPTPSQPPLPQLPTPLCGCCQRNIIPSNAAGGFVAGTASGKKGPHIYPQFRPVGGSSNNKVTPSSGGATSSIRGNIPAQFLSSNNSIYESQPHAFNPEMEMMRPNNNASYNTQIYSNNVHHQQHHSAATPHQYYHLPGTPAPNIPTPHNIPPNHSILASAFQMNPQQILQSPNDPRKFSNKSFDPNLPLSHNPALIPPHCALPTCAQAETTGGNKFINTNYYNSDPRLAPVPNEPVYYEAPLKSTMIGAPHQNSVHVANVCYNEHQMSQSQPPSQSEDMSAESTDDPNGKQRLAGSLSTASDPSDGTGANNSSGGSSPDDVSIFAKSGKSAASSGTSCAVKSKRDRKKGPTAGRESKANASDDEGKLITF